MNKFDKTRNGYQQYDMVSLFQSAQERTMRHLNVSSLAKVKAVNGTNITAMLFPKRKGTETIEINAYNLFNSAINAGDIILVVFTDRDFNGNLATIRQGNDYVAETGDDDLHSLNNAVAIEITPFSESELKLKTIDYQSIKGEGNIDLSLTYALKSNLENNYYTKSEINERLTDDFYTKGEIDSKLNGKQNKATPLGNNITPVYIDSNGNFALCTSYTNASVKHADSANNANSAEYSESATYAIYLGENESALQYSASDIHNSFNSKQDKLVTQDKYIKVSGADISLDIAELYKELVPYKQFYSVNTDENDYDSIVKGDFFFDNDTQSWYISTGNKEADLKKIVLSSDIVDYATHLGDGTNSYTYTQIKNRFDSIGANFGKYLLLTGGTLSGTLHINQGTSNALDIIASSSGASAKGLIGVTSSADNEYNFPLTTIFPNLGKNHGIYWGMGKEAKTNNKVSFGYVYVDNGSNDNSFGVSFYGQNTNQASLFVYPNRVKLANKFTFSNVGTLEKEGVTYYFPNISGKFLIYNEGASQGSFGSIVKGRVYFIDGNRRWYIATGTTSDSLKQIVLEDDKIANAFNADKATNAMHANTASQADKAYSADTATNADNATFAQYLGEDGSALQYSANDIKNGFNSKQDRVTALGNITTPVYVSKDGVLSACTPYSEAQVSYANNFSNFGTRNNNTGWGILTASNGYTIRYGVDLPSGGGMVIAEKNSQTSVQIDGDIYVDEGHSKVATESQVNATKAELESKISSLENEISELKNIISGLVSYN